MPMETMTDAVIRRAGAADVGIGVGRVISGDSLFGRYPGAAGHSTPT